MRDLNGGDNPAKSFGTSTRDCFVSFAGSATTGSALPMIHNLGVVSVVQSGTGIFVVTLSDDYLAICPDVRVVGDKTRIHDITLDVVGTKSFTFTHFASATDRTGLATSASNGATPVAVRFDIQVKAWSRT